MGGPWIELVKALQLDGKHLAKKSAPGRSRLTLTILEDRSTPSHGGGAPELDGPEGDDLKAEFQPDGGPRAETEHKSESRSPGERSDEDDGHDGMPSSVGSNTDPSADHGSRGDDHDDTSDARVRLEHVGRDAYSGRHDDDRPSSMEHDGSGHDDPAPPPAVHSGHTDQAPPASDMTHTKGGNSENNAGHDGDSDDGVVREPESNSGTAEHSSPSTSQGTNSNDSGAEPHGETPANATISTGAPAPGKSESQEGGAATRATGLGEASAPHSAHAAPPADVRETAPAEAVLSTRHNALTEYLAIVEVVHTGPAPVSEGGGAAAEGVAIDAAAPVAVTARGTTTSPTPFVSAGPESAADALPPADTDAVPGPWLAELAERVLARSPLSDSIDLRQLLDQAQAARQNTLAVVYRVARSPWVAASAVAFGGLEFYRRRWRQRRSVAVSAAAPPGTTDTPWATDE